jgi:hypothetical protein
MRLMLAFALLFATPAFAHDPSDAKMHGHENVPVEPVPAQRTADGAVYGASLQDSALAAVRLDEVVAAPDALLGKPGAFEGRITQVCQKQGCWMVLSAESGDFARVFMHDHAFSVPKDARGEAVVYGTLDEKVWTEAEIEHLRKDGAEPPAARELRIDATSVLIREAG